MPDETKTECTPPGFPVRLLRAAVKGLIRIYQLTLSAFVGRQCRYLPTCSDYTSEAVEKLGVWRGLWMGFARFSRCGPFGASGYDPVPLSPDFVPWYLPWKYGQWSGRHLERDSSDRHNH